MDEERYFPNTYAEESIACLLGEPLTEKERLRLTKNERKMNFEYSPILSSKEEYTIDRDIAYFSGSELTAEEISEIYSRN